MPSPRIAVLAPCHNEALTIGAVVAGFRAALPGAVIYVYENNSTDDTAAVAAAAGAVVRRETLQGKGHVVRRMFADVDSDIYIMVDGDGTYAASDAPALVARLREGPLDMVVARRRAADADAAYRRGHVFGNRLMTGFVASLFGARFNDIFSGYRAFSRRFVKSFPALAGGFEIETELTIHALELHLPVAEIDSSYGGRAEGSASKLNTWSDGARIALTIMRLYKDIRPFRFFGSIAVILAGVAIVLAEPLLFTFLETGLVPRLPTAVLATGIMLGALLSFTCGLILDSVARGRREAKRMAYLAVAPLSDV